MRVIGYAMATRHFYEDWLRSCAAPARRDDHSDRAVSVALSRERDGFIAILISLVATFEETHMHADDIKARLRDSLHRHPKATEDEVEAVAAVVLAIVGELTVELAVIIGDLAGRVSALEANAS